MTGMTLMMVDDNKDLLDFLREALHSEFAEIITVTSGNKALAVLSSGKLPDIIVSDINMPDGDGYRLCSEVKNSQKYGHIPFILLTSRGEDRSQSDSYRMGADSFLAKPFEVDTLLEMIRSILKRREDTRRKYLDCEDKEVAAYGSKEEAFILALNRVITEHISDPELDQTILCSELGLSRASLYNKMKAITGTGVKEYITHIRLEKAKALIENSNLSIAEISDMTGFASQSYFSTAFKAYVGQSPSQYKKSLK
jgi:YesN/AraC family two-component response regulator